MNKKEKIADAKYGFNGTLKFILNRGLRILYGIVPKSLTKKKKGGGEKRRNGFGVLSFCWRRKGKKLREGERIDAGTTGRK